MHQIPNKIHNVLLKKHITLIFLPQILQDFGQVALTFLFLSFDLIFLTHFFAPAFFHCLEHRFCCASLEHVRPHLTPVGNLLSLQATTIWCNDKNFVLVYHKWWRIKYFRYYYSHYWLFLSIIRGCGFAVVVVVGVLVVGVSVELFEVELVTNNMNEVYDYDVFVEWKNELMVLIPDIW